MGGLLRFLWLTASEGNHTDSAEEVLHLQHTRWQQGVKEEVLEHLKDLEIGSVTIYE